MSLVQFVGGLAVIIFCRGRSGTGISFASSKLIAQMVLEVGTTVSGFSFTCSTQPPQYGSHLLDIQFAEVTGG
ncbi:MAG: hypothetical protein CYG59_24000 [Chloroflexi bacterium]|nr:MAG: hypothetical protein CYG59_24000 [Chloroflexota bacterium]